MVSCLAIFLCLIADSRASFETLLQDDECAEGAEACSLEALQRRAIQLEASQEEPAWEESVLAAWAHEPGCQGVLRGQCGAAAVVVEVEPESGGLTSKVYTAGAGGGRAPFDETKMTSIFPVASNSKILTSILLVVALADHGKVSMGETVSDFLGQKCSDLPEAVAKITLVQLSSHTSGLPAQPTNRHMEPCQRDPVNCNPYTKYTEQDLCETLREVTLGPKGHYLYSNLAFGMLGYFLELRMGLPYEQLAQTWVLHPLNMTSARVTLNESQWHEMTPPGKDASGEGRWRRHPYGILQGNGAFLVSVPDMGRLLGAMIKAERGQETPLAATLRQTLQPLAWSGYCACDACEEEELLKLSIPTAERGLVAMGWESSSSGLRRGWHKSGDIAGYSSWMAFNAALGRGAFGVDTCGGCGAKLGSLRGSAVQRMVRLLADGPPEKVVPLPQVALPELGALVGDFKACPAAPGKLQSTSLATLSLTLRGTQLLASTTSFTGEEGPMVTATPVSSAEADGLQAFSGVVLALSGPVGTIHGGPNEHGPLAEVSQRRTIHFLEEPFAPNKRGAAVLHIAGVDIFFVEDASQCP
ncbi:ampH [Symbiodinium natans]|uniref:AmpH protein n=1 Tax=Symbiodinium natans TaxID=878477 RepID=A0A812P181_9DINO|nr:ampH [Symbiodinium natans]